MKLPEKIRKFFQKTGAQGGASTSKSKRAASRENGKKGGRPKKVEKTEGDPMKIVAIILLCVLSACGKDLPEQEQAAVNQCHLVEGTDVWECTYPEQGLKCQFRIEGDQWFPLGCSKLEGK